MRDGRAGNPKSNDGAPPDESNALPPPAAGIPPAPFTPGAKPRLVEKLAKDPKELSEETLQLMEDSKNDDEEAQDELHAMAMKASMGLYMIMIASKAPTVQLGHSLFKYMSRDKKADPYHQHTIVFVSDRTQDGNPMAYALPPNEAKKIGKWKQVEWDSGTDKHKEFFAVEGNINKLFVPRKNKNLTKEKTQR